MWLFRMVIKIIYLAPLNKANVNVIYIYVWHFKVLENFIYKWKKHDFNACFDKNKTRFYYNSINHGGHTAIAEILHSFPEHRLSKIIFIRELACFC